LLEPYRSEYFAEVKSFAQHQPEFDYLLGIIKAHTKEHVPGGVWVWRKSMTNDECRMTNSNRKSSFINRHSAVGSVVAICGMAYLNRRDAWLYGMRVDPGFKGQGRATRLTRALFGIAAASGHTWVGLDTLDHPRKAPVLRITEKLGMKLEGIYATAGFRDLPRRNPRDSPCFPKRKAGQ
jgi:GNAT superfamily N-acetyltransferase